MLAIFHDSALARLGAHYTAVTEHTNASGSLPQPVQAKDILCLGYLQRVFTLLDSLHDCGCERDKAGNRRLFYDDYVKLMLVYIWNPAITSLRDLQQAAALPKVAKALGVKPFSLGSFSESVTRFEPQLLVPIIAQLAGKLTPTANDPRLAQVQDALTLVDGTILRGLTRLAKVACPAAPGEEIAPTRYNTSRDGLAMHGWRLHTQFDLKTFSVHRLDRTGARNAGAAREHQVLHDHLEPDRCYVCDGGYADHTLFDAITDIGSSYVIRSADNAVFNVREERLLSQEAPDAGIVRDAAALAIGASRHGQAFEVLRQHWRSALPAEFRRTLLLAMATIRTPEALATLLGLIASENWACAVEAVEALGLYAHDAAMCQKVKAAVEACGDRRVAEAFGKVFAPGHQA